MKRPTLEHILARRTSPEFSCEGIDEVLFAEYLDGVLEGVEKEALEAHLASCSRCRYLIVEAGLALPETNVQTVVPSTRRPVWWALAAILLLLLGLGIWRGVSNSLSDSAPWTGLGISTQAFQQLEGPARALATAALNGELAPLPALSGLAEEDLALRTTRANPTAVLISPRWSNIRETNPQLRFALPDSAIGRQLDGEILMVDEQERLVMSQSFELLSTTGIVEQAWPPDQSPLEPGRIYAWKINLRINGEWLASAYVPFKVVNFEITWSENDGLAGFELLYAGLHEEALQRWSRLEAPDRDLQRRLMRSILKRQQLPELWIERELGRWLGSL